MTDHENCCEYNMADSCCAALTVRSLLDLAGDEEKLKDIVLDYGPITGSLALRRQIASLYEYDDPDSVTLLRPYILETIQKTKHAQLKKFNI